MKKLPLFYAACILAGVFAVALGFNTIDQMIIRYKYYDYWRTLEHWEMSYFWSPDWWDIYIASVFMLIGGGFLLGLPFTHFLMEAKH